MQAGRKIPEDWKSRYIYRITKESFGISCTIPRSTWAKHLSTIGFEEVKLIELRIPKQGKVPELGETFKRLEQAAYKYRMGDYKGSMIEIREVIEAIEKLKTLGDRNILSEAIGQKKFEKLKDLLAKMRDFCGIAGHEAQTGVEIYRSDARLAIEMVWSLLDYVNTALS